LSSVDILSPEANFSSSHKTKTTSFRRCGIAEPDAARDFLLKTGLKSDFGSVDLEQKTRNLLLKSIHKHTTETCILSSTTEAPAKRVEFEQIEPADMAQDISLPLPKKGNKKPLGVFLV
jgi:hypothetical protein